MFNLCFFSIERNNFCSKNYLMSIQHIYVTNICVLLKYNIQILQPSVLGISETGYPGHPG